MVQITKNDIKKLFSNNDFYKTKDLYKDLVGNKEVVIYGYGGGIILSCKW